MKVIVAYDFSDYSDKAVKYVLLRFHHIITKLDLCHIIDYRNIVHLPREELDYYKAKISKKIEDYITNLIYNQNIISKNSIGYCIDISDDIASSIVNQAKSGSYDLIVTGRRGLNRAEYIVLGSVSKKIVEKSDIPVLIVP